MKALVVDRDRHRAHALASRLARRGWETHVAHSAHGALALMRATPDVGVLYVSEHLSAWSGPDLLAALERSVPRSAPAIVIAVQSNASVLAIALRAGGVDTVSSDRPFDEIAAVITRAALERTRERDAATREQARGLRTRTRQNIVRALHLIADAEELSARSRRLARPVRH